MRKRSGKLKVVKAKKEEQLEPVAVCALLAAGCCFKERSRFARSDSNVREGAWVVDERRKERGNGCGGQERKEHCSYAERFK